VWTCTRGGKRAEKVVTSKPEAEEEGVKNPPKVRFPHLFGGTEMLDLAILSCIPRRNLPRTLIRKQRIPSE